MINTIYFDMDGVLVDLSKGLSLREGYDDPVLWFINMSETLGVRTYPAIIEKYIDEDIFVKCPPMPHHDNMKQLIDSLKQRGYKVKVLSSCMDKPYSEKIVEQKRKWLDTIMPGFFAHEDIHIVKGSQLKIDYVDENSILIDDYQRTYNTFVEKGIEDRFVLYRSFDDCVNKLQNLNII